MPVKFEWQAEQEHEWTDEQAVTPGGAGVVSLRKHWRIWLVLLGLVLIVGGAAYVLLNRQAEKTSDLLSDDVLASHQLVTQTVARRDVDVFATMLFPYSRDWSANQIALLDHQFFWDRTPLGLWSAPQLSKTEPEVTLAPDLQTAVVTTHMPYIIEKSDTMTETVTLLATAVYANNDGQWQLAPPDEAAFWGQTRTAQGDYVRLSYPERDTAVSQRLVVDLDTMLADLCRLPAVHCSPNFQLRLTLDTDEGRLLALERDFRTIFPRRGSNNSISLRLPAPTLVGLPLDEAGYDALLRGYGGWITAVLYTEFNRNQQPDYQTISQALAQLELRPPPLFRERPWQAQTPAPIPLPEQNLLMICYPNSETPQVWHYDLANNEWREETAVFAAQTSGILLQQYHWPGLTPLPDGRGAVVQFNVFDESGEHAVLFLWQVGQASVISAMSPENLWLPVSYMFPAIQSDRYLFFYDFAVENPSELTFYWLDMLDCPDCELQSSTGFPYWSPDESKAILLKFGENDVPELALLDAAGVETAVIGPGWLPIWLDNETFAYVRPESGTDLAAGSSEMKTELIISNVAQTAVRPESLQVLLHTNALLAALPEGNPSSQLALLSALPHPHQPDMWYLLAMAVIENNITQSYLFSFDAISGAITALAAFDDSAGYPLELAGNGRYLTTVASENNVPSYFLYDLAEARPYTYELPPAIYPQIDWSANGRWLVLPEDGLLRLIAPGSRYERPLFHGLDGCGTAVWVNR